LSRENLYSAIETGALCKFVDLVGVLGAKGSNSSGKSRNSSSIQRKFALTAFYSISTEAVTKCLTFRVLDQQDKFTWVKPTNYLT
jgi:hypothetical protein